MCKTLYKYFLLTATSFGACAGLYLLCLTGWLWPWPNHEDLTKDKPKASKDEWDWKDYLKYSGLIGFLVFSPGIVIVIRSKPKELQYYGILLLVPFVATLVCSILQMSTLVVIFEPTDWYMFGIAVGLLAIIVNLFLLVNEINTYGSHHLISTAKYSEENAV